MKFLDFYKKDDQMNQNKFIQVTNNFSFISFKNYTKKVSINFLI